MGGHRNVRTEMVGRLAVVGLKNLKKSLSLMDQDLRAEQEVILKGVYLFQVQLQLLL